MSQLILIIEDEPSIAENIAYALTTDGYLVKHCTTAADALSYTQSLNPALAILDIGLPDLNGFELFKKLRESSNLPVIFLTARSEEVDRVIGLELGADDYIVKPFSPRELTARVRAVLRRSLPAGNTTKPNPASAEAFGFKIDELRYQISFEQKVLPLSRYEYRLLKILIRSPGRVFTREQLMTLAWEEPEMSLERTVDAHIKNIRAKLREVKPDYDCIQTHRGLGYSFKEGSCA